MKRRAALIATAKGSPFMLPEVSMTKTTSTVPPDSVRGVTSRLATSPSSSEMLISSSFVFADSTTIEIFGNFDESTDLMATSPVASAA
jgi:hypothetical protein